MVMREGDKVNIWEATPKHNVSLRLLSCRVDEVHMKGGDVAIRKLVGVRTTDDDLKRLEDLREDLKNLPYETDELELIKSAYDGPLGGNKEDLDSIFCSELVAEAYQCLGLLQNETPSNEFTPKDFSVSGRLRLSKGRLGNEIVLSP